MAKQKFALRDRVIVPDTDGQVQGVIVSRLDQISGPSVCGVAYLSSEGKHFIKTFSVPDLIAGRTKPVFVAEPVKRKLSRRRKFKR